MTHCSSPLFSRLFVFFYSSRPGGEAHPEAPYRETLLIKGKVLTRGEVGCAPCPSPPFSLPFPPPFFLFPGTRRAQGWTQ